MKLRHEYIFLVLVLIVFILFIKRSTSYANASKVAVSTSIPAPPPSNCSYSKVNAPNAACNAPCGSTGTIPQIYQITKPAVGSGTCPVTNGSAAPGTPCAGTPCPVPCQYATVNAPNASCNAPCGGSGTIAQVYNITTAARNGGTCSVTQGAPAPARACTGPACPPVNCQYTTVAAPNATCSSTTCNGTGTIPQVYHITSPAQNGGSCAVREGQSAPGKACTGVCTPTTCEISYQFQPIKNGPGGFVGCHGSCGGNKGTQPLNVTITRTAGNQTCPPSYATTRECKTISCDPPPNPSFYNDDFVVYTGPGTDLPGQPMTGTAAQCSLACLKNSSCKGFSWPKGVPVTTSSQCWLKQNISNRNYFDPGYETWVRK